MGKNSHEKSCRCLCHQTLLLMSNPTVLHVVWHQFLAALLKSLSCFTCIRQRLSLYL